jgi:hypothetical protein
VITIKQKNFSKSQWHSIKKAFGEDHPNTINSYSNLASVLQDTGDYYGAKMLLEEATISAEKNFGKDHPSTAHKYHNLSTLLFTLGNNHRALELSNSALVILNKVLPAGHPNLKLVNEWNHAIKSKIEESK